MKIIISGGLGYVGGRLTQYFAQKGHTTVALSRQAGSLPHLTLPGNIAIQHPEIFAKDPSLLHGADVFIHLAALNENDCVKYPEKAIDVNVKETWQWLEAAHKAGIQRFIYFSTAHIYGKPLEGFYDERSLPAPVHPYAITHKAAEDYVLAYSQEKAMNNLVIRLTNSFGPPAFPTADRWTLLVNDLCRMAVNDGKMVLHSDGRQLRDFVCLQDVCTALDVLMHKPENNGVYNLGSGVSMTVWDMALIVQESASKVLGKEIPLLRANPTQKSIPPLEISVSKLRDTGWTPVNNIASEIAGTLQYFQVNRI
jgi:UDP-glucose 4-epimerase